MTEVDRMSLIGRRWLLTFDSEGEPRDIGVGPTTAEERCGWTGGWVVPEQQLQGAVCLTDAEWERVLCWLHKPVPPGPAKALDESIIRKIANQRGQ
jgi:hypothetical protein